MNNLFIYLFIYYLLKVNYFNCDKYQAMVLGNPKGGRHDDLDICGEKVEQTQSIKI